LAWRRDVAAVEENNIKLAITPFEKNIEVWKQLWRVIEKSQLLFQIVDGRNPFFYYSQDLE
jgi:large subunit GTPase 1